METTTIISIAALLFSTAALPMSYWIAVRQVRVGLDEQEKRNKIKAREYLADRIEEFLRIFSSVVKVVCNIEPHEANTRINEINARLLYIDDLVQKTGVLVRLSEAIDRLQEAGFDDLPNSEEIKSELWGIRNLIARGSDENCNVTSNLVAACLPSTARMDIQRVLREA
jgi:hypothetical protein